ncbi:hypothetical protein LOAG_01367 [Loa loa]|uniref:Ground-like domain-containing protein n=1 Tax=Loa loa TaxID=7209 RepID=A0A1I7VR52_LOALO|nr:hypothetical protein LOAG_01367 [Loa loa]EFO27118.1 hypothetical protein LOAG_01367 [Loa loa]
MAILIMLTVLVVIFPPSKSLEPLPRPTRSQDLGLLKDKYEVQSGIRQSLLEELNKFPGENSEKLVMLRPNNIYQDYSQITDEKHQRELILGDQYHVSEIQPNNQTTLIISKTSNRTEMNAKISQKSAEILDEWKQIRERRLRFYKAFRKIQNLRHGRQKYNEDNSTMNINRIVGDIHKTSMLNDRRKKNKGSLIDPVRCITTDVTFNDWETFITDYGKVMPQYNRRRAISSEITDINSMSNQFLRANESTISSPFEYDTRVRKMQSSGVAQNPPDYQQLVTNLNSAHQMVPSEAEAAERLPPPPNPKSTEASVHTVKVYPPSQQPSLDYQEKNIYQNNVPGKGNYQKYGDRYGGIAGFEQQPMLQLMSNDYNVDAATYRPEVNSDCIDDPCEIDNPNPLGSIEDERCNSPRLKQIILQNIVQRDAETSKQAIYNVCEAEMEVPCNVICGTGFYSYLARATQFCLVSTMDVSCYAFLPACDFNSIQKRWIKRHRAKI